VCAQAARKPKTIATGLVGNGNTLDHSPRWPHEGRGHSHCRALRTVADRLLSVACTVLEQQTLFDLLPGWGRCRRVSIRVPSPCSIENDQSLRPDLPPGRASRAAAVKDATANAVASAEPAQSVLDRASTVLRLPWRHYTTTLLPRLFRLIIGGRPSPSSRESSELAISRRLA